MSGIVNIIFDFDGLAECLVMMTMLAYIFEYKSSTRRVIATGMVCLIGYMTVNSLVIAANELWGLISLTSRFVLFVIAMVFAGLVFAKLCLKGNPRQFLITALYYKTLVLFISFLYKTYPYSWPDWISSDAVKDNILRAIGLFLIILTAFLCGKMTRPIRTKLSEGYWITAALLPPLQIALWIIAGDYVQRSGEQSSMLNVLLLAMTFLCYALFSRLAMEMEKQMDLQLNNQTLNFQIRQVNDAENMLNQARKARHELKNNYFVLESLLEQEKYDEMQSFLNDVIWPEFERQEMVSTGDRLVDMVLSNKISMARQKNIPIVCDVLLSEEIKLRKEILCSLISNLLDNAIEASVNVKEPDIFFLMQKKKGYLAIEVRNRIDASVLKKNPGLSTTKKDAEVHGIGLKLIRQATKYLDGSMDITEVNDSFVVRLILPDEATL